MKFLLENESDLEADGGFSCVCHYLLLIPRFMKIPAILLTITTCLALPIHCFISIQLTQIFPTVTSGPMLASLKLENFV